MRSLKKLLVVSIIKMSECNLHGSGLWRIPIVIITTAPLKNLSLNTRLNIHKLYIKIHTKKQKDL